MTYELKRISAAGITEAIAKVELYRSLNEPEEAESICRDILAIEPQHQLALRLLGLALTDQFTGGTSDRYREAEQPSSSSATPMSGSTTQGFFTNDARRPSSTPDSLRIRCCRSSTRRCAHSLRPKKSAQRETTIPSFAGIAAYDSCKPQPMNGNRNRLRSIGKTQLRT